jgi:hypothetical protein
MQTQQPKKLERRWLKRWADRMAAQADVQVPHWFVHNAAVEDGTFCFACGEKRRIELRKEHKDAPEILSELEFLDGGYSMECDGCEHCAKCGQLLSYSLTNYGAESEWAHFVENGINLDSTDVAYHVQAILDHGLKLHDLSKVRLRGARAMAQKPTRARILTPRRRSNQKTEMLK